MDDQVIELGRKLIAVCEDGYDDVTTLQALSGVLCSFAINRADRTKSIDYIRTHTMKSMTRTFDRVYKAKLIF